jgi:hypothetical protein
LLVVILACLAPAAPLPAEDQGLKVKLVCSLVESDPLEGVDLKRPSDGLPESLVRAKREKTLRLVRVVCPNALVVFPTTLAPCDP